MCPEVKRKYQGCTAQNGQTARHKRIIEEPRRRNVQYRCSRRNGKIYLKAYIYKSRTSETSSSAKKPQAEVECLKIRIILVVCTSLSPAAFFFPEETSTGNKRPMS